jgi:uncharacterized membrane protein YgdD (TMEM256/DUF423 family)
LIMTRKYLVTVASLGLFFMVMVILNIQFMSRSLSPSKQHLYDLATNVLMIHTIALLSMTFMNRYVSRSNLEIIYYFFSLGVLTFSVPLYLMATEDVTNIVLGVLKPVSIFGALGLLFGWLMLLYTGFTYKHKKRAIHNQSE